MTTKRFLEFLAPMLLQLLQWLVLCRSDRTRPQRVRQSRAQKARTPSATAPGMQPTACRSCDLPRHSRRAPRSDPPVLAAQTLLRDQPRPPAALGLNTNRCVESPRRVPHDDHTLGLARWGALGEVLPHRVDGRLLGRHERAISARSGSFQLSALDRDGLGFLGLKGSSDGFLVGLCLLFHAASFAQV